MKKVLSILVIQIIIFNIANAQSYFTIGAQNKGVTIGLGMIQDRYDLSLLYDTPFESVSGSRSLGVNLGYKINLSNWGEDDYIFTPTIGLTNLRTRVFSSTVNKDGQTIEFMSGKYSTLHLVPGFEIGENINNGRFSLIYKRIEKNYYGISIRVFMDKIFKKGGFRENFL